MLGLKTKKLYKTGFVGFKGYPKKQSSRHSNIDISNFVSCQIFFRNPILKFNLSDMHIAYQDVKNFI